MHTPVLLEESIKGLNLRSGNIFIDGTIGSGGHSEYVCKQYGNQVLIIGIDVDKEAIDRTEKRLKKFNCQIHLVESNFRDLDEVLKKLKIQTIDAILLDLGTSFDQLELAVDGVRRGFSFKRDEPLLMTLGQNSDINAMDIVNNWQEENIFQIINGYGEERFAKQIAKEIIKTRKEKRIETTFDLVEIIEKAVPTWYRNKKIHCATKTFQALRIAVNDELRSLEIVLKKGFEHLNVGGRIAVISFHSLEDRIVKKYFRQLKKEKIANIITKKPICPTRREVLDNPRARSSKLRILEKI